MNYNNDDKSFRKEAKIKLKKYGIDVDIINGKISRDNQEAIEIKCKAIYLLRHAKTLGTINNVFMSDFSENSHITYDGIKELIEENKDVGKYRFDYAIICSNIPRVKETGEIFKLLNPNIPVDVQEKFKGINNGGWENKNEKTMNEEDLNDYNQREIKHNIFAKSSKGESWCQVLLNCMDLIDYLNENYKDKRVLLIGQGSILTGLQILTNTNKNSKDLWKNYNTKKLFNLESSQDRKHCYSKISCLYDKENISDKKVKLGLVYGRFQVLHHGHMDYIIGSLKKCEHLIIGICNPESELTKFTEICPHRSKPSSNPLTYFERMECIKGALLEANVSQDKFDIVPFPINYPEKIFNYAPKNAKYFIPIFEPWGAENVRVFKEELGLDVEVIIDGTLEDKRDNATNIREMIYNEEDWSKNVPNFVYKYIKEHEIDKRIKKLISDDKKKF